MKAIISEKYGSPDVLELQAVEKPTPKANKAALHYVGEGHAQGKVVITVADSSQILDVAQSLWGRTGIREFQKNNAPKRSLTI